MFNPFKKKNTNDKPTALPVNEKVQAVLDSHTLYGQPLMQYVERTAINAHVLEMQMRIFEDDDTAVLEAKYHELQQALYPLGIHEVNLNVTVSPRDKPQMQKTASDGVGTFNPTATASDKIPPAPADDKITKTAPKQSELSAHPRISRIVAVASGKGGVGKSTTTVNLALALAKMGKKVGVLDADIYGPSIHQMFGVANVKPAVEGSQFIPINAGGIAVLSIGNLIDADDTPVAWRGIKATGALMQLYGQTSWPLLDYLLIDMPPGTGDIQLTLAQRIPMTAAVVVTTPQHIALLDAKKGVEMFNKTGIAVAGIIENMALHTCSACGHTEAIFGSGGGDEMAAQYGVPLLGRLPLATTIREQMDVGTPQTLVDSHIGAHYAQIAEALDDSLAAFDRQKTQRFF